MQDEIMRTERLAGLDTISEIEMSPYHPLSSQSEVVDNLLATDRVVSKQREALR
jgi:hypothetical protein